MLFSFSHRTPHPHLFCAVLFFFLAPYTSSATILCGALLLFRTVHLIRISSVRCSSSLSHRTPHPQPFYAVLFFFFAPYASSASILCGALLLFRTVRLIRDLPIRCITAKKQPLSAYFYFYEITKSYFARRCAQALACIIHLRIGRIHSGAFLYHRKAISYDIKTTSEKLSLFSEAK